MVLIDMEMPASCLRCPFYTNGGCKATMRLFPAWMNVASRPKDCPIKPFIPPEPQITTNIYDQEEIHHGCAVQILRNSVTGDVSVGWWEESEEDDNG